ncbi:DDHD family phospholipase [Aspergillus clavatus NRRL 1]|uniref:DDHD domain protein n=1 Tax=Aspergillus clavatus (strain ATCC 1007 / CBS 513.65 / DSM 816 / NCTC 3887 / NRRL 1 / QM 1276 / 107) TaxID=344612 RepID=A1C7P0_ASPCL|nr:DDHD domain protein [Aspergillus clavatus NRRL 1]EAW14411.1 DDHD domain protein [Aspergillus clavatus NRRL 1]
MAGPLHTYGPSCLLTDDDPDLSSWHSQSEPPKVRIQFFYTSSLPIDDPLSALPPPSGGQTAGNERTPPQPFSIKDNINLEEAWKDLRLAKERKDAESKKDSGIARVTSISVPGRESVEEKEQGRQAGSREGMNLIGKDESSSSNIASWGGTQLRSSLGGGSGDHSESSLPIRRKRELSLSDQFTAVKRVAGKSSVSEDTAIGGLEAESLRARSSRDASISGSPFARAPPAQSQTPLGRSIESISSKAGSPEVQGESSHTAPHHTALKSSGLRSSVQEESPSNEPMSEAGAVIEDDPSQTRIPVGVSRLHLVELPNLKMKPLYWSPLHDASNVLRATWFYKNTMLPVETELANRLEDGYLYLKPWTDTWQDELNSCVDNGADAEMKIVHRLWPKDEPKSSATPTTSRPASSLVEGIEGRESDPLTFDENRAAGGVTAHVEAVKPFLNSSVIYVDGRNAQILRPSLLPSVSRGRRPLSAIRKGRQIGIPVVRGFSRRLWERLYPSKPSSVDVRNYLRTQTRAMSRTDGRQVCYACVMEESRPTPTDLVLVIHGIGQKLSERMESFHFTHAINAFRRSVNMELNSEPVWPHVREGHGGIMVLPVNWRSTLSLDDAALESQTSNDPASNHYSLKDITPETIPAVRSLISDVMLDIPYYLSHHKPKMIQAVVKEANRIYRLWCQNNPGFQQDGRVHLLAHSLGSAMAIDILSHQPTKVSDFDFSTTGIHSDIFEFDTKNLFLCGSPVGFFLLLNKANLLPRRGRDKPGYEGEDRLRGVAGEADTYGCLAVDNLYNIMHTTDPIAYRVNAAVDADLANSLKIASIPGSNASFWSSFGSVFRWSSPSHSTPTRPAAIAKLPSNVEMETHDFTREEIAEKRMLLLNDNGQIDYFISGGGGPLNIQYLNMLSAHSSYWILTDFVRFIVIEVAREQGREATLPALRAEKKKGWKIHKG